MPFMMYSLSGNLLCIGAIEFIASQVPYSMRGLDCVKIMFLLCILVCIYESLVVSFSWHVKCLLDSYISSNSILGCLYEVEKLIYSSCVFMLYI